MQRRALNRRQTAYGKNSCLRSLGVRYVLEGAVHRDQGRVRVNAQFVDAETGAHLWADRFAQEISPTSSS